MPRQHAVRHEHDVARGRVRDRVLAVRHEAQRRRERPRFVLPVVQHAGGHHHQCGPGLATREQQRQGLHGLAESHVVREDRARARGGPPDEKLVALDLVVAQRRAQILGHRRARGESSTGRQRGVPRDLVPLGPRLDGGHERARNLSAGTQAPSELEAFQRLAQIRGDVEELALGDLDEAAARAVHRGEQLLHGQEPAVTEGDRAFDREPPGVAA